MQEHTVWLLSPFGRHMPYQVLYLLQKPCKALETQKAERRESVAAASVTMRSYPSLDYMVYDMERKRNAETARERLMLWNLRGTKKEIVNDRATYA